MKIIAFYLPQFHVIPENDEWWGKGFTEWVNVKKALPLFDGHNQPRIPLNQNYYDLSDNSVMDWQIDLAHKYGVYGFCFYHYWFDGHLLLQKPVEAFLANKKQDLPFCICWANEHWTNAWVSQKNTVLIEQRYGGKKEWKEHFDYLLPFFKDKRYIVNNNKPFFVIYRPEIIDCLNPMLDYWQELAIENGFDGIEYAYQHVTFFMDQNRDDSRFAHNIEYQPIYAQSLLLQKKFSLLRKLKRVLATFVEKNLNLDIRHIADNHLLKFDYDDIWNFILKMSPTTPQSIPGAFVDWDNTPRRGNKGTVYLGTTPEKFHNYLKKQIIRARDVYKSEYLFMFAWNEWAEGGNLEPDEKNRYGYLEAIHSALESTGELEQV